MPSWWPSSTPKLSELVASWRSVRDKILAWRRGAGLSDRPLVFTELGYASIDGCASKPWDYTQQTPIDLQEQALCYQAFFRAWSGRSELAGVFVYEWWGSGGLEDRGYTPRGKPAEEVVRRWFARDLERSAPGADEEEP